MKKLFILSVFILSSNSLWASGLKEACLEEFAAISNKTTKNYKVLNSNRWMKFSARCDYKVFQVSSNYVQNFVNKSSEYVGVEGMKKALLTQERRGLGSLEKFRRWAEAGQWNQFGNSNHFDWWMFPIADESSQDYAYTVFGKDIEELKNDRVYLSNYREGLRLMFASWGWNLENGTEILNKSSTQRWRNYDVRLRKAIQSMILFNQEDYLKNAKIFVNKLVESKVLGINGQILYLLRNSK